MLSLVAQGGFNLSPLGVSPDTIGQTLLLYALSTLNFLAFITLFFVLLRNILKLVRERRAGRLGSKFKARLVGYSIGLSFLPVLLLFFFAFGLINRSIDRWFGEPTRQIVEDSHILEDTYFARDQGELTSIARVMDNSLKLALRNDISSPDFQNEIRQDMENYDLALVRVVVKGKVTTVEKNRIEPDIEDTLAEGQRQLNEGAKTFAGKDDGSNPAVIYAIAGVRSSIKKLDISGDSGHPLLLVAREFPRAANIDQHYKNIDYLRRGLKALKDRYVLMLALVTLLLIFAAVWLALHVARGITVPIQALAEATDRVAKGDFSQPVDIVAEDELAGLVNSFNEMAGQLSENREQLEAAAGDLRATNQELLDRRRYIETVLESLSTGVISTDERTGIATINRAAMQMLSLAERPESGTPVSKLLGAEEGEGLSALCRRAGRGEKAQADLQFPRPDGSSLHTATTAIVLRDEKGAVRGWVIVIEDLTDLIQAERAAAWSEVARRMAHEIKNPLTPIQLSAERIYRNYQKENQGPANPRFDAIVSEGTSTIIREVGALQRMVEEFSRFARLPEVRPVEGKLNDIIEDTVRLYADRSEGIKVEVNLDTNIPVSWFDPDQIKRVLINLIENAIEAVTTDGTGNGNGNGKRAVKERRIRLESHYQSETETIRVVVADNGHGIKPADRDKLFLPKFSTRNRGTGLGLAIVSHIVSDHNGRIWVEDNRPRGAKFVLELPIS